SADHFGPAWISLGKNVELRANPVANTRPDQRIWASLLSTSLPTGSHALRRFTFVRFGTAPVDFHQTLPRGPSFFCFTLLSSVLCSSFVPHGSDARLPQSLETFRLSPDAVSRRRRTQRPCLVGEGFPPSGSPEDLVLHRRPSCSTFMPVARI